MRTMSLPFRMASLLRCALLQCAGAFWPESPPSAGASLAEPAVDSEGTGVVQTPTNLIAPTPMPGECTAC